MSFRRTLASNVAAAAFALSATQGAVAQTPPPEPVKTAPTANMIVKNSYTEFNPHFSPEVLGGMGLLYMAFYLVLWRRGMKGHLPFAFTGAVLFYGLANYQQIDQDTKRHMTETLIVVDESPSQALGDRKKETADAHADLEKKLKELPGVNVRVVKIGGDKDGMQADGTRILDSISAALSDVPRNRLGGVFIATDGQVHDTIADNYTLGAGVPVHALISGTAREYDRRVEIEKAPSNGQVGKKQDIAFRVIHEGAMPGAGDKVPVSIHQDGKQISTQMVTPGQTATVSLEISHAGENIIEIKAASVSGELTDVNNQAFTTIEGIRGKLKVLLVSGSPNPNTRMWRSLLKSEPDVDVVHFMVLRLPEQDDDTPRKEMATIPFPLNEAFAESLSGFDLMILDNYGNHDMLESSYLQNLASKVTKGGSLLVASGAEYAGAESIYKTPLAAVLPAAPTGQVTERSFAPRVSERGQRHPVTRGLENANAPGDVNAKPTWGAWGRSIDVNIRAGETVLEGPDKKPLLILSHQEKGRVAMLNSDSMWRWERGYDSSGPYAQLLLQTAHWLMQRPALEEEALRITQVNKELVIEQQTMGDQSIPVVIRAPSGKSETLTPVANEPGLWRVKVPAKEMGLYSVEQGGKYPRKAAINVGPSNPQEYVATISTPKILEPLVKRTGGVITRMTDASGALAVPSLKAVAGNKDKVLSGDGWMGVRMTEDTQTLDSKRKQVVDNNILAILLFLSMAATYAMQSGHNPFKRKTVKASSPDGPGL